MTFCRYARLTGLGNEQPGHNLRFPLAQRGPATRTRRDVERATGRNADEPQPSHEPAAGDSDATCREEVAKPIPTSDEFLTMLDRNAPPQKPSDRCPRLRPHLRLHGTL